MDETLLKELQNQVEGLDAHMEYIQENITESQGTIMGLEVKLVVGLFQQGDS